jgi:hypothetical protein
MRHCQFVDPFYAAIEACQTTRQAYEQSIHEIRQDDKKKAKGILFAHELELRGQLHAT